MKFRLRGWRREVFPHEREVTPVSLSDGVFKTGTPGTPLNWTNSLKAYGLVKDLNLTGNFLLEIDFEAEELRNWLKRYSRAKPKAALRLLKEMEAEATIALAEKLENRFEQKPY